MLKASSYKPHRSSTNFIEDRYISRQTTQSITMTVFRQVPNPSKTTPMFTNVAQSGRILAQFLCKDFISLQMRERLNASEVLMCFVLACPFTRS